MKISYNWLKSYLPLELSPEATSALLTDTGLEVEKLETFESIPGMLEGVVVGEVMSAEPHPDADRLKITKVDLGSGEPVGIVCGAPNVAQGQKVLVATVGTVLFQDTDKPLKIKRAKIRGVESTGMICAEDELGLGTSHDGIMVLPAKSVIGTPASELFELETDSVFEIGLTPNRTDAFGHFGVARDIAARLSLDEETRAELPELPELNFEGEDTIKIDIQDKEGCGRYAGIHIQNLKVGPSPDWLQNRLKAVGLSPINNVVDITNFVQHETGQPLHAFDGKKIKGNKVLVKTFKTGTKFTTLDGQERELHEADLMIANGEEPMCIAGVFGGIDSGVTENTNSIFLESAWFNPVRIRKTAKRHGLNTDASFRFERGVDPQGVIYALKRAANLVLDVCSGSISGGLQDVITEVPEPINLDLSVGRINRVMGLELSQDAMANILKSLDFKINSQNEDGFNVAVPTYRVDVTREVDVAEEILRINGYNKVASPERMTISVGAEEKPSRGEVIEVICNNLVGRGLSEMMANGLTSSKYVKDSDVLKTGSKALEILNPLSSELDILRPDLLSSMLEAIGHNLNRQAERLMLFEIGKVYELTDTGNSENTALSIGLCGNRFAENWNNPALDFDLSDLRGHVQAVFDAMGLVVKFGGAETSKCYGVSQTILNGKREVGRMGIVHPSYLKLFGIKKEVLVATLDLDKCLTRVRHAEKTMQELPKFPSVRRDLSLLLDDGIHFEQIKNIALAKGGNLLESISLFDVYEGKNLPEGKKSYAVSFILRDKNKTLNDKKIDYLMNQVQATLEEELGASLR